MRNISQSAPGARRSAVALLATATLSLGLSGCGSSDSADGSEGVTIKAALQPTSFSVPFYIAQEQGYFEEAGLTVESEILPNAGGQVPLIASGDAQFAVAPIVPIVVAKSQGLPLIMVAPSSLYGSDEENAAVAVIAPQASTVENAGDLDGKNVAVIGLKATPEQLLRNAIEKDGGDPDRVNMIQMDYPTGFSALDRGEVEAMIVTQPFISQALDSGSKVISYPELATDPGGLFAAWFANSEFMTENPEDAKAFIDAINKANEYANEHPDEVNALLAERNEMSPEAEQTLPDTMFGTTIDEGSVEKTVADVERFGWSRTAPNVSELIWKN